MSERTYLDNKHYKELDLSDEVITDYRFVDCTFEDCKFRNIKLDNCEFLDCEFINCDVITVTSENSDVKSVRINKCNLIGVNWSELISSKYSYASPIYKMNDSFIKYSTFSQLNLAKVDLKGNVFDECMFDDCDLSDSKFNKSEFKNSPMTNNNLIRSNFEEASGYYIDLNTNKITNARFSYPEVSNLLHSLDITIV